MLIFIISFSLAIGLIASFFIHKKKNKINEILPYSPIPFSVSDYLDRIDKAYSEILTKKESNTDYSITLWLGLDGLKLNDDGSTEWIRKYVQQQIPAYQISSQCQNSISQLTQECQSYQLHQQQMSQTLNMINQINPPNLFYPSYLQAFPTYHYPYYPYALTSPYLQCCCNYEPYKFSEKFWLAY